MLFPGDRLDVAFRQIKLTASSEGLCTYLLASNEADSVCAVRLVQEALKSESISFSTKAINSFSDVERILTPVLSEGSVRSVILINCGGSVNLQRRFGELLDNVFIYVIDSHRPIHHMNLSGNSKRVLVFGGEIETVDDNVPDEDDPDDATLSEDEEDDDIEEKKSNDDERENEEKNEEEEEEAFADETTNATKATLSPTRKTVLESPRRKRMRRDKVLNYYSRSYIGDPASHVAFSWLQQIGKDRNMSAWLAIVGVTSRYLSMDMDDETYMHFVNVYRDIVLDKNLKIQPQRTVMGNGGSITVPSPLNEQISFLESDLRLTLYRHWSLYDACYNTGYFASRFGVWSPDSDGDLARVFAKLGLSMKIAKQKFSYMSAADKETVKLELPSVVRTDFEFKRMIIPSFTLRIGFSLEHSADDMARCLNALLAEGNSASSGMADNEQASVDDGFTKASDLILRNDRPMTQHDIELAMAHARLLTEETKTIIQGSMVQSAGDFRFAVIELHDDSKDNLNDNDIDRTNFFSNATNVVWLAKHLINAHQGSQKWLKNNGKPLVLAVSRKGKANVVGVPCPSEVGEVVQNPFGRLFARTLKEISVEGNPDQFLDSYIIQLYSTDVQRFLLSLSEFFRV